MKNIQIIDSAANCVYDIFAATEEEFSLFFETGQDIAFVDEIYARVDHSRLNQAFQSLWTRRVKKSDGMGIQGTIFYGLQSKAVYYPTRRDEEAINPGGSRLR